MDGDARVSYGIDNNINTYLSIRLIVNSGSPARLSSANTVEQCVQNCFSVLIIFVSRPPQPLLLSPSYLPAHGIFLHFVFCVSQFQAPEPKIRSGGSDDIDVDECSHNWIHFNTFRTYGNECVDVKEGSHNNLIEDNICENQQDENSGGFGLRGSDNIVRYNEISDCVGAAVRIGGDKDYGTGNQVYGNKITAMGYGAFNLMSTDHGQICDNAVSDATVVSEDEMRRLIGLGG